MVPVSMRFFGFIYGSSDPTKMGFDLYTLCILSMCDIYVKLILFLGENAHAFVRSISVFIYMNRMLVTMVTISSKFL